MKHIRKFDVNKRVPGTTKRNCYEIIVDFMIGDADGSEKEKFTFTEKQMSDPKFREYVSDFIESILGCIKLDGHGRVGFDDSTECTEWYAGGFDRCGDKYQGVPSWSRFCQTSEDAEVDLHDKNNNIVEWVFRMEPFQENDNPFAYYLPSNENGFYCSYEDVNMYYYDNEGVKFNVSLD